MNTLFLYDKKNDPKSGEKIPLHVGRGRIC